LAKRRPDTSEPFTRAPETIDHPPALYVSESKLADFVQTVKFLKAVDVALAAAYDLYDNSY